MSKHSFTPGPWEVTRNGSGMIAVRTASGAWITYDAGEGRPIPEREANASLIASAPDLLAVVQALLDAEDAEDYLERGMLLGCAVEMARAALTAALPHVVGEVVAAVQSVEVPNGIVHYMNGYSDGLDAAEDAIKRIAPTNQERGSDGEPK